MIENIFEKAKELSNLFHQDKNLNIFGEKDKKITALEKSIYYQTRDIIDEIVYTQDNLSNQQKAYINTIYKMMERTQGI